MMYQKLTIKDAIKLFCDECQAYGLLVTENTIIPNGKKQRCPVLQSKHSKTSGSYLLYALYDSDFPFNGFIYNFNTSEGNPHWNVMPYIKQAHLQQSKFRIQRTDNLANNIEEQTDTFKKVAYIAYKIYQQSNKYPSGPNYLDNKQVKAYGVKFQSYNGEDDILIIPGRDLDGQIWTLQFISSKEVKHFLKSGRLKGVCHKIGFINLSPNYDNVILICEGYATGASIYMATHCPTICAFSSGNLPEVGGLIRTRWPNAKIVYCADADYAGINKAIQAKKLTNGIVAIPFLSISQSTGLTDFNDLHTHAGLIEVKEQILLQFNLKDMHIDSLAESLLREQINDNRIPHKYLPFVGKLIEIYFIPHFAKSLMNVDHDKQIESLNKINPRYKALVVEAYVTYETTRIFNIKILKNRQQEIARINPKYQNLVKQQLRHIWNEKRPT